MIHPIAFALAAALAAPQLESIACYERPAGAYHAILRNTGDAPARLAPLRLQRPDGTPVHAWWMRADAPSLAPGARTHFAFALKRARSREDAIEALFHAEPDPLRAALLRTPAPLAIAYAVRESDTGRLIAYLRNESDAPCTVAALRIDGEPVVRDTAAPPFALAPGQTAPWIGTAPAVAPVEAPRSVLLDLDTAAGPLVLAAPLFSTAHAAVRWEEEEPEAFQCPTHRHGTWDESAAALLAYLAHADRPLPTVQFCRNRLPEGVAAFGQCPPRATANLQASNLDRGAPGTWDGLDAIARRVKTALEPGIYAGLLEDSTLYAGAYGMPTAPDGPPLAAHEIRAIAYTAIGLGSKGLIVRTPLGVERRARLSAVMDELRTLLPLIAIGDPVPLIAQAPEDRVRAYTLQCAGKAVLLAVIRRDPTQTTPLGPIPIVLHPPPGMPLASAIEVGGLHRTLPLDPAANPTPLQFDLPEPIAIWLLLPPAP